MRSRTRIAVAGLGLMLAAASACDGTPGGGGTTPPERRVEARLLTFHQGHGLPRVSTVLRSETDAKAFPGWFAQVDGRGAPDRDEIAKVVSGRDYGEEAVVAFSYMGDCTSAEGAELTGAGRVLSMRLTGTTEAQECYAPWEYLAVFAVDRAKVPADLEVGGSRTGKPDPPGPAELTAFAAVSGLNVESQAAEISQPDQLDGFLDALPEATRARLDSEITEDRDPDVRRFGFVFAGCRVTSAVLTLTPERMYPQPVGGENIRCVRAEHFAAIFTIDAEQVPPKAKIG